MERKIINIIIALIIAGGIIAGGGYIFIKKIETTVQTDVQSKQKQTAKSITKDTGSNSNDSWKKYRNEKYGFEISYPAKFATVKIIPPEENKKDSCGEQIGESIKIALNENFSSPIYEFAIYSNSRNLSQKDFFICKITPDPKTFNENKILNIRAFKIGKQNINATKFLLDDLSDSVLTQIGDNIYEFSLDKNENESGISQEFDQILAAVDFFKFENDAATTDEIRAFCASAAKNEFGDGLFAFYLPLNEKQNGANDLFAACAKKTSPGHNKWNIYENTLIYHLSKNNNDHYQIIWNGNTDNDNNFNWKISTNDAPIGDINNDGWNEIVLTGSDYNGNEKCSRKYGKRCLYSPVQKDIFCAINYSGWSQEGQSTEITRITAGTDCLDIGISANDPEADCTGKPYAVQCFEDDKIKNPENAAFKDYLIKTAVQNKLPEEPLEK